MQLQLVTATVKLFLKRPTERVQQMIQLVLTFATQVSHIPESFGLTAFKMRTRRDERLQLVTATVKPFLKRPTERVQQMIHLVLTFATQV